MFAIKPSSISLSKKVVQLSGKTALVVTVMAGCRYKDGRPQLCSEKDIWKSLSPLLPKGTAHDLCFPKPRSEWIALGHVYPASADALSAKATVTVERAGKTLSEKKLHVSGPRVWMNKLGIGLPSKPEPIGGPLKLDWAYSFGGVSHEINPTGIGFYEGDDWESKSLPQIEEWDRLIAAPNDNPIPAGFAPLPLNAPSRWKAAGSFEDYQASMGIPDDMPREIFMTAPADQWIQDEFMPGDLIRCEGMLPAGRHVEWYVPDWTARSFIERKDNRSKLNALEMKLDTLMAMPGSGILVLTWRGMTTIQESDAYDVNCLFGALESISQPREVSHYENVLKTRIGSKRKAVIASLNEAPLLPKGQEGHLISSVSKETQEKIKSRLHSVEQLVEKKPKEPSSQNVDSSLISKSAGGVDSAKLGAETLNQFLDSTPDANKTKEILDQASMLAIEKRKEALSKLKQEANALPPKSPTATPPSRRAAEVLRILDQAKKILPNDQDVLSKIQKKMDLLVEKSTKRYRQSVHRLGLAEPKEDPKQLGEMIYLRHQEGHTSHSRGSDWLGVELSAKSLDGLVLAEAFLDGANFKGSSLRGADFTNATLSHADFSGCDLTGANFNGANLGHANLSEAILDKASMKRTILDSAILDEATFTSANLKGASFIGTQFGKVSFAGANLSNVKWLGLKTDDPSLAQKASDLDLGLADALDSLDIGQVSCHKATLKNSILLGCSGEKIDMRESKWLKSSLVKCDLSSAVFIGANLEELNVVQDTVLRGSDFTGAQIIRSYFRGIDLTNCVFVKATIKQSMLSLTKIVSTNFSQADASGSRFERAMIKHANFNNTKLVGARFSQSSISCTDFSKADLTNVDFNNAKIDSDTDFSGSTKNRTVIPNPSREPIQ